MKNFKRILAIVMVVMMVVPMMTTGLTVSAATAESLQGQFSAGATFAGGNWKAYSYNDWSDHMGAGLAAFDDLATYNVDADGQITLYNQIQQGFNSYTTYGWVNLNPINVLQSTNTTAIDGLYFRNGMPSQAGTTAGVFTEEVSYAFSENQLLGSLSPDVFTKENGFAVEGGMVTDGLVINMVNTDNDITSNGAVFNTITAYVMDGGKIVSSQSFDTAIQGDQTFGLCVGHAHNTFISFVDGVVTFHVEDNYSANGAYFNQTYTFDQLDTTTLSTYKDYYFCVGSKGVGEKNADGTAANPDGSVNLNLARIGTFTVDAATGLYTTADGENKNIADWTGHGTVSCVHETWSDWTQSLAPSCTTTGIEERTCQGCGKVEQQTVAALGHSYGDWTVDAAATCTTAGSQSKICSVCGDVATETIAALGHSYGDWTVDVEATCTTDGSKSKVCSVCSDVAEETIAALGHDWTWNVLPTADTNGKRTCDRCAEVEEDLAYDLSYYWTTASDNMVENIDAAYAEYNNEYNVVVGDDGSIELQDMALAYVGDYDYYPMLKATTLFKTDLEGFYATVEPVTSEDITIPYQYPTTLSFMWTNYGYNYDEASEYSVYNPSKVGLSNKLQASRYGHIYNNYLAGEYSFCAVLADTSFIYSQYDYGTPNDGVYDWLYSTVVSNGNYWTTKMDVIAVDATAPITVGLLYEFDPTDAAQDSVAYVDINGELYCPGVGANHQLLTSQEYYFSVAAYGDGVNQHTASFKITDVCGQAPATFNGFTHECYTEHFETAATCAEDGYAYDICLACKTKTNEVITPATGVHTWSDATCTEPKTCSVCGATEGAANGHTYVDFYCSVCSVAEGAAYIENESGKTLYADLQSALTAAVSGDKVVLLKKNEEGPYTVGVQQNIDIDLNGFNIRNKSGDALIIDGANVYIYGTNGGTVRSSDGIAIVVKNSGYVNIMDPITVRCSSEEGFDVLSVDETSKVMIHALGGRYYKDPTAAGAILNNGLAISGEGTNWTVVQSVCPPHSYVVTDVVAPTCTENGYSVYTCELCGDSYNADPVDAEGHPYSAVVTEPTCTEAGYTTYTCDVCGDSYTDDEVAATGHTFGEWFVTTKPTYTEVGEETRVCEICATPETREIPTKDWLITFDTVGGIMPEGVPTEMGINTNDNYKEATGYDYPVPTYEGGGYTFGGWYWDVYNFILDEGTWNGGYFAVSQDVALEALWFECEHTTWSEWVADETNSTQSRTCLDCGLVETEDIFVVEADVVANGNVISVTGLDDSVKDVFISKGEWTTYAEMKPNKIYCITPAHSRVVDGAFDYTVAENGTYTVMIRYNDGTTEAKVFVVECTEGDVSALTVEGNTVTVTGLNDLLVLRHVAGEYTTSYDIKRADGVVNVPGYSKRIVDGVYTVTLEPGTYSFVTQFNDGNFVYYTVVIEAPVVAKDYTITFDTVGGEMPEGVPTEIGINYQENYKEAAGFDYPVPTMEGWVFDGWIWNEYNYILTEGDWNGGYYAVQQSIVLEALWVEATPVA